MRPIMKIKPVAVLLWLAMSGTTQAALHDRGSGLIYDDVLNATWLQDANYAMTSGYDHDGIMTWEESMVWVAQLEYGGYANWRLPTTSPVNGTSFNYDFVFDGSSDRGYNISASGTTHAGSIGSEMAYMYYNNLQGMGDYTIYGDYVGCTSLGTDMCLVNGTGPFINIGSHYWSGSEYLPDSSNAWQFAFIQGGQNYDTKAESGRYAWAVRDGDVAAIPEAETYAMFLVGLGLVSAATRWRRV